MIKWHKTKWHYIRDMALLLLPVTFALLFWLVMFFLAGISAKAYEQNLVNQEVNAGPLYRSIEDFPPKPEHKPTQPLTGHQKRECEARIRYNETFEKQGSHHRTSVAAFCDQMKDKI